MTADPLPGGYVLPTFVYRRAPELDGKAKRYPVAVVGAGLAGLTATADLASRGVPVVLLDEDDTVGVRGASSRGICYAQKSLETFVRLGIYDRIAEKGVTWSVGRVLCGDEELYSFDLARGSLSEQPPFINIQQFYVEWFLVDRIDELPVADVRWRSRVTGATAHNDHVRLRVETPDGPYDLEAQWVVDCSGHASIVREAVGITPRAEFGVDRWCIADVRFRRPMRPERWTWMEADFNGGRAVWQHQMADGVWRIDYQMPPDSDPAEISRPEVVRARLQAHLGSDTELEVVWIGPYSYRTQRLDNFRASRIFFVGDAAHVFSPFGARGGNSGIQDAENLGWKLAAVLAGEGSEALLDSYDTERRSAAEHNIRVTSRSARFLAPRSAFERELRKAVASLARSFPFARALVNTGRMSQAFDYWDSPLTTNGGAQVPNVPIRQDDGTTGVLADLLKGPDAPFLVLCFPGSGAPRASSSVRVFAVGEAIDGLPLLSGDRLESLGGSREVLVIRPDQHLAARLIDPSRDEVERAIARARGGGSR
ncbi:MAG TPA: FAD-dependent monooxygenase [Microvirga sp.]|jgi:3-(3-hydroxy-phenyl)propionate hydroxylase|nr:FAD-dependent monooxygenase [Microvirga sp.]